MVIDIENGLKEKKFMLIHAPTGLGKTAAALSPILEYAIANNKTIFFLTSRHTQQDIVFETINKVNEKNQDSVQIVGIIGKKHMCSQTKVEELNSGDFAEYCKALTADKMCTFYENSKKKTAAEFIFEKVRNKRTAEVVETCRTHYLCPYEITIQLARTAKVIVSDYYYMFNPFIRQNLFSKIRKELKDAVIIIDEAHNLAGRLRNLWSTQLSNKILILALKEAKKYQQDQLIPHVQTLIDDLNKISAEISGGERIAKKSEISVVDKEALAQQFEEAAKIVLVDKKRSAFTAVANFLNSWDQEAGYSRILKKEGDFVVLKHNCIDAAILTKEVFEDVDSVVAMSGTLLPLEMYADVLGFPKNALKLDYPSPFPDENRLIMVIPRTTTKFSKRSEEQFKNIANGLGKIINSIQGNSAVFFPSYYLRDKVLSYFNDLCDNSIFLEQSGMTKEEKDKLLAKFKTTKNAVLLGVATGSFGEGIDLPGILKGVVVVGLPLEKPDLETQKRIEYYEDKFRKGWDYGYVLPAMTKCFQNVGRCIRTEKDKGVLVFLDERFVWPMYAKSFPKEWKIEVSVNPVELIDEFF